MSFDLSTLAAKETFVLQLKHPVTEDPLMVDGTPVTIEIYGQSSKQHRNALTAMQNKIIARKKQAMTGENLREESIDILVAISKEALPASFFSSQFDQNSTEDNFRKLYSNDEYLWLKNQVQDGLNDLGNFIKA